MDRHESTLSTETRRVKDLSQASPAAIRAEIERTRAEMDETLDRISSRVQPRHLLDEVVGMFQAGHDDDDEGAARRSLREAGTVAADKLKSNPVPVTLIGAGLAWLLFQDNGRSSSRGRRLNLEPSYDPYQAKEFYGEEGTRMSGPLSGRQTGGTGTGKPGMMDRLGGAASSAGDKLDEVGDRISGRAHSFADRGRGLMDETSDRMHMAGNRMRYETRRAGRNLEEMMESAPLAFGVGALAAGLIAGLIFPATRTEEEFMGSTAGDAINTARERGEDMLDSGKEVAQSAGRAAMDQARQEGIAPTQLTEKVERVAESAKDAGKREADRQM